MSGAVLLPHVEDVTALSQSAPSASPVTSSSNESLTRSVFPSCCSRSQLTSPFANSVRPPASAIARTTVIGPRSGNPPGRVTSPSTYTRGPLISRTSTATEASWMNGPSFFVRPCCSSAGVFGRLHLAREWQRDLPVGANGHDARQLRLVPHDDLDHVLAPDAVLARVRAGLLRGPGRSACRSGEENAGDHCPLREHHQVPPGTLSPETTGSHPAHLVPRRVATRREWVAPQYRSSGARGPHDPACAQDRAAPSEQPRPRPRTGAPLEKNFPRVGTIVPALPRSRGGMTLSLDAAGWTGSRRRGGWKSMLRAAAWTLGLFGVGTAIVRMFPESA